LAARHNPRINRFPIPHAEALDEIRDLASMKKQAA
jgi:hypothetical protein